MVPTKLVSSNSEIVWKMALSGRSNLIEIDQTHFPFPRSHTSFKNYEIWNLAITSHPGSNKSGFVEFRGRMQNGHFHGLYKFHSDLSENSFGHNFCFPLWKFDFSDSLERYSLTDLNIFGFTKIRFVLHPALLKNRHVALPQLHQLYEQPMQIVLVESVPP